jgi:hypothetical protein
MELVGFTERDNDCSCVYLLEMTFRNVDTTTAPLFTYNQEARPQNTVYIKWSDLIDGMQGYLNAWWGYVM